MVDEIRRSKRYRANTTPLPRRLQCLFHSMYGEPIILKKMEKIHSNPNIYRINNFLSDIEIEYFNQICTIYGKKFESSFMEDSSNIRVISEERTSTFLHLGKFQDNIVRKIEQRAADMVSLPITCVEPLQIVSYTKGQKFNMHHDAGTMNSDDNTVDLVMPKRLVTIFVYLNDLPPGQGETAFPVIGFSCQPVRGSAIMFCNLLPSGEPDHRTAHQACPVDGNLWKYGVNIWIIDENLIDLTTEKPQKILTPSLMSAYSYEKSAFRHADRIKEEYQTYASMEIIPPVREESTPIDEESTCQSADEVDIHTPNNSATR